MTVTPEVVTVVGGIVGAAAGAVVGYVSLRKPKVELPPVTGKIWNMWEHQGPTMISFHNWPERRISGFLPKYQMKRGDEVRAKLIGGSIARFVVLDINWSREFSDIYVGQVADIGEFKTGELNAVDK